MLIYTINSLQGVIYNATSDKRQATSKLAFLCLISTSLLVGCDKVAFNAAKCNSDDTKKLVTELIDKDIDQLASEQVKTLINTENVTLDMGKVRSAIKQLTITVDNVRTSNSDPNSKKQFCVAELDIKIPSQVLEAANESRKLYNETDVAQQAVLSDIKLELNQLKHELEYAVQPTDDAKKIYVSIDNQSSITNFVSKIIIDSLSKSARQSAIQQAEQAEAQRASEQAKAEAEYAELQASEAKRLLDAANANLNLIWNATTKDVRNALLDDQKAWLKKRELECKMQGNNAEQGAEEIVRLNCETEMTNNRTEQLRQAIYRLESGYY